MARQAASLGTAGISRAADLFHDGLTEMRGTTSPRLLLELICARVLLPAASLGDAAVLSRVERIERRLEITGDTAPSPTAAPRAVTPAPVAPVPPPAPEPPAWPTAAVPGTPEPVTTPEPEPVPEPPAAAGGLDATAIRRSWDAVLEDVNGRKRTTKALLLNAQVLDVQGKAVTLGFTTAALARTFQLGTNEAALKEALQAVLGLDATLVITTATGGEAPGPGPAAAPVAAAPVAEAPTVPAYEGLAPGDEIEPEDPDNPQGERIGGGGEDAAIALLKDQLGGTVLDE
jgi:DNA polymerase-3 subunit gamma/tau